MISSFIRTLSFFSKWLAEVLREPALMLSLVLGPFLILLAFGSGTQIGVVPPPKTIVVATDPQAQEQPLALDPDDVGQYLTIVDTTSDAEYAIARLARGEVELVAVLPHGVEQTISQGQRARIQIFTNEIDPLRDSYAGVYLHYQISALNQGMLQRAIATAQGSTGEVDQLVAQGRQYLDMMRQAQVEITGARQELRQVSANLDPLSVRLRQLVSVGQGLSGILSPTMRDVTDQAGELADRVDALRQSVDRLDAQLASAGGANDLATQAELARMEEQLTEIEALSTQVRTIPPEVLSAPFALELNNVAPFEPTTIGFYAPAVLTLLLQHLAVTLGALSMARVRLLGLMELLQASPVRPSEVVVGNYLSYGTLCVLAAAVLVALLVGLLGVPVFGEWLLFVSLLLLLIVCSLGVGFIISMISSSEQQAAQIAMLVLISSVFFSGFMIFLDAIDWPVRAISYMLPATYAIRSLRDVMLKGILTSPVDLMVLAAMSIAFFVLTIHLFRREFRPR